MTVLLVVGQAKGTDYFPVPLYPNMIIYVDYLEPIVSDTIRLIVIYLNKRYLDNHASHIYSSRVTWLLVFTVQFQPKTCYG